MQCKRICLLVLILASLYCFHSAADNIQVANYSFIEEFRTESLEDFGSPYRTYGSIFCDLDPEFIRQLLESDQYYNYWVIPGLNYSDQPAKPRIMKYNTLLASDSGSGLVLDFSLLQPIQVDSITIPFSFSTEMARGSSLQVRLCIKEGNIAIQEAIIDIIVDEMAGGTIITISAIVDFTFMVDLFLSREVYAENAEMRLGILVENFMLLASREAAARGNTEPENN